MFRRTGQTKLLINSHWQYLARHARELVCPSSTPEVEARPSECDVVELLSRHPTSGGESWAPQHQPEASRNCWNHDDSEQKVQTVKI